MLSFFVFFPAVFSSSRHSALAGQDICRIIVAGKKALTLPYQGEIPL